MNVNLLNMVEDAEKLPSYEPMKHRFKSWHIPWAYSLEDMPFDDCPHEFGIRRKEFIRKKNERVRKPYWRKKRREQKRAKKRWKQQRLASVCVQEDEQWE